MPRVTTLKKKQNEIIGEMSHKDFSFIGRMKKKFPQCEIYLVGGAVRDLILSRPTKDFDFVVRGVGAKNLEKFLDGEGDTDLVGRHFGVFKFLPKGRSVEPFDIALPRTEHSLDEGGYRDFDVQSDPSLKIEDDLSRRDFTVNAIAYRLIALGRNIAIREVVDPWNGKDDIKKKIIRTVGDSDERFREDYSRLLRGLRFAIQLGFEIEPGAFAAIGALIPKINDVKNNIRIVPTEIIAREFLKSFAADPVRALDLWDKAGAIGALMPELLEMKGCVQPSNFHSEGDVWTHTRLALSLLKSKEYKRQFGSESPSAETILGVLFHDIGKPRTKQTPQEHGTDRIRFNNHDVVGSVMADGICERLTLSAPAEFSIDAERIANLARHHLITVHGQVKNIRNNTIEKYFFSPSFPGEALQRVIFCDSSATIPEVGKPDLKHYFDLRKRIAKLKKLSAERPILPPPVVNGDEIMKWLKLKPGPEVGRLIRDLREEQLSGKIKTKAQARSFLKKHKI
ncbi:CCA tRNA nucleotidyltransferase [Candidatus Uhrbacteria bacterium]|nr:CCA tRNA nucleotidyltransferase [Candidatus Uhrbacteria bacterium]